MAFESLSDRFTDVFKKMRKQDTITEKNMDAAMREIRVALLEADVNFKVVKSFTKDVKEAALGQEVLRHVNPGEQLIKICHDELVELLGSEETQLNIRKNNVTTIMLVGLQGAGKTTTAGKLAYHLKNKEKKKVLLAGLDVYRPAAIDQLGQIASDIDVDFFNMGTDVDPVDIAKEAQRKAQMEGYDFLILDTAGRLQIDTDLMDELSNIVEKTHPDEILLLVDAMSGQDASNVANAFQEKIPLTGIVMSKLDGDAKGGAALSIKYMTGLPIKFAGIGEKLTDLTPFYPERLADRILGMGDIVSLVEKAQENIDEKEAKKQAKKMMDGQFTLDDMLKQMKMVQKMGSLGAIAKMIPGMPKLTETQQQQATKEMKKFEAIVSSMTPYERAHPEKLKHSHKQRIAKGSGTTAADVNRVIKKYDQSKKVMKEMKKYKKNGGFPPGMMPPGFK